jgi:acetyl-CoA acetyltransferase
MTSDLSGAAAITGLGLTEMGKVYGKSLGQFAVDAAAAAIDDAGLSRDDIDGLLVSWGVSGIFLSGPKPHVQTLLGLRDLRVNAVVDSSGATAVSQIEYAALAVASGAARHVLCVFADAPLTPAGSAGASGYAAAGGPELAGLAGLWPASGLASANAQAALAARRHMNRFGTTSEQLGAVAVAQRQWAAMNPLAQQRDPITLADHQASRWIVEPLRLLDCCLVSNGGVAFVITSAERARDLAQPPVYIWGWGQGHPAYSMERGCEFGLVSGAVQSGAAAMGMAGIKPTDVDVCELYDCYTITVLITLEDYGFCAKGEGGPFAGSGALGPGGSLPTNTGGGQLSGYYLWGVTPLSEAVIQARGQGGERQAPARDVVLVSGNGGVLDYHGTVVLSPHAK